ncbi:MAG: helix-turn-helix domain-containing protein [Gammaproteobacteria bacterium]
MPNLITPAELPTWVPGEITANSDGLGWRGVGLRGYHYRGQDTFIPPLRDFMIVAYARGATFMERRVDGGWKKTRCVPSSVSLLTRSQVSHWHWTEDIDVHHVYLTEQTVSRVAVEVLERPVAEVQLRDVLNATDPVITAGVAAIAREAGAAGLGGALYVDAIAAQLAIHLLRNYADISFPQVKDTSRLGPGQRSLIEDFIESNLDQPLDLETLAGVLGLGVCAFSRRFRQSFGCAPYAYVVNRRVARAREMLLGGSRALKQIAADCGFSDQAHMTRVFRSRLGTTPGALRKDAAGTS